MNKPIVKALLVTLMSVAYALPVHANPVVSILPADPLIEDGVPRSGV